MAACLTLIIGAFILALYVARIACYAFLLHTKLKARENHNEFPGNDVTLLVPFRNELEYLPNLLE